VSVAPVNLNLPDRNEARISAVDVIVQAYSFIFANARAIVKAVGLPVGLATLVLWVGARAYFSMLAEFAHAPSGALASQTMSITIALYFVWLLFMAVAAARVTRLAQGESILGTFNANGVGLAARIYTATLRYQGLLFAAVLAILLVMMWVVQVIAGHRMGFRTITIGVGVASMLAIVVSVRSGMLIPAIAYNERRSVLRRGWALTHGVFWPLLAIWFAVTILPILALEVLGELVTRSVAYGDGVSNVVVAAERLAQSAPAQLAIVGSVTLAATHFVVSIAVVSGLVYRALVPPA
jgi:hypothetical protein